MQTLFHGRKPIGLAPFEKYYFLLDFKKYQFPSSSLVPYITSYKPVPRNP